LVRTTRLPTERTDAPNSCLPCVKGGGSRRLTEGLSLTGNTHKTPRLRTKRAEKQFPPYNRTIAVRQLSAGISDKLQMRINIMKCPTPPLQPNCSYHQRRITTRKPFNAFSLRQKAKEKALQKERPQGAFRSYAESDKGYAPLTAPPFEKGGRKLS